jgi:rare lipoprotein A
MRTGTAATGLLLALCLAAAAAPALAQSSDDRFLQTKRHGPAPASRDVLSAAAAPSPVATALKWIAAKVAPGTAANRASATVATAKGTTEAAPAAHDTKPPRMTLAAAPAAAPETSPETAPATPAQMAPAVVPSEAPRPSHGRISHCSTGEYIISAFYWEGTHTASGARFDPDGMTAAHRTLPFGTHLVVLNPRNGKTVTVTINDRGPFVKGVTLDLSRGAAKAIGLQGTGAVCMAKL